jgi:hypothetical protein
MTKSICCRLLAALAAFSPAWAIEIATGKMLGSNYDARAFYVRDSASSPWRKTYTGRQYRAEAGGRLMNLRIAQGLFHDEWLTEVPFDPDKHTDRLIQALDSYKAHGIIAINVSLQGGNMAYDRDGRVKRSRDHKLGPGKGSLVSAFRPDGSLKPEWMKRALKLQRELDKRGMILDLLYFYQHQDELFENTQAIDRAALLVTDWLIDNNCRNVIIEIANEHDVTSYDHDRYIHHQMGHLIALVKKRFADRTAPFRLPVSASTGGSMRVYDGVIQNGDLVIIHGNGRTPDLKRTRVAELVKDSAMPGPIFMNEDDNGRETTLVNLSKELGSLDAVFDSGGSWGYMPWIQLQIFPFRHFQPGKSARVEDAMPLEERDPAYFKAVLEHIRKRLFQDGPSKSND